jgi:toxin-antitoxin system PIN domain toxin
MDGAVARGLIIHPVISFDTNILVHASNLDSPDHAAAKKFLHSVAERQDVVICELMLVETYLKLRNTRIMQHPYSAKEAESFCRTLRSNPDWLLVESAPVMKDVWDMAGSHDFALRRIIDARLALTLRHYGVTEFATANLKDFTDFGFTRVWNPLAEEGGR